MYMCNLTAQQVQGNITAPRRTQISPAWVEQSVQTGHFSSLYTCQGLQNQRLSLIKPRHQVIMESMPIR